MECFSSFSKFVKDDLFLTLYTLAAVHGYKSWKIYSIFSKSQNQSQKEPIVGLFVFIEYIFMLYPITAMKILILKFSEKVTNL